MTIIFSYIMWSSRKRIRITNKILKNFDIRSDQAGFGSGILKIVWIRITVENTPLVLLLLFPRLQKKDLKTFLNIQNISSLSKESRRGLKNKIHNLLEEIETNILSSKLDILPQKTWLTATRPPPPGLGSCLGVDVFASNGLGDPGRGGRDLYVPLSRETYPSSSADLSALTLL